MANIQNIVSFIFVCLMFGITFYFWRPSNQKETQVNRRYTLSNKTVLHNMKGLLNRELSSDADLHKVISKHGTSLQTPKQTHTAGIIRQHMDTSYLSANSRQEFIQQLYSGRRSDPDSARAWPSLGCFLQTKKHKDLFSIDELHFPCHPANNIYHNTSFKVAEDLYFR